MKRYGVEWRKAGPGWLATVNGLAMSILPDEEFGWLIVCTTAGHQAELRPFDGMRARLNDAMFQAAKWAREQEMM